MNDRHDTTASALPTTRPTLADAIAHAKECFAAFDAASPEVEALEYAWFNDRESAHKAAARQDGLDRLGVMSQANEDAIHAVIAAPILSLADMRAKAQYLASVKGLYFDEPAFAALLANMAGDAQSSAGDFPGYQVAFERLEGPISHLLQLSQVQETLLSLIDGHGGRVVLDGDQKDALMFVTLEIRTAAGELDDLWTLLHSTSPDASTTGGAP